MREYPDRARAGREIIEFGRRMYERGYVAANDGNISVRLSEDTALVTPTGVSKGYMSDDTLIYMTLDGRVLKKGSLEPSSEVKMHLRAYRENPDMMAVVHAHPPYATACAAAGACLSEALLTEAAVNLGVVPVAKYAAPGTQEVPDSIAPFCRDYNAVLLSNHGALTWGRTLEEAYFRMEWVEFYAHVTVITRLLGSSRPLSRGQVAGLMKTRAALGITAGGIPGAAEETLNGSDVL